MTEENNVNPKKEKNWWKFWGIIFLFLAILFLYIALANKEVPKTECPKNEINTTALNLSLNESYNKGSNDMLIGVLDVLVKDAQSCKQTWINLGNGTGFNVIYIGCLRFVNETNTTK